MWWRRRRRTSADLTSEIPAHLELEAGRLQTEERGVLWWDHLRQDARSAIRSIAKSPVACLVAVASLAGGIGATTATLTLRNAIFYNPPPLYAQPSELSRLEISTPERRRAGIPGALYDTWLTDGVWQGRMAAATAA